jgi:hypothetical protein
MGREGRSSKSPRFVKLEYWVLNTVAWKTMPPDAKALYIEVCQRYDGGNNGEISYSVREAEQIGLSRSGAGRAFDALIERGFLKVRRASAFTLKTKEARTWQITAQPMGTAKASADFTRWAAPQSHQRDRETDTTGTRKFKTQSQNQRSQSHQRDREPRNATLLPLTVPPAGLSAPKTTGSQSHQRDTSNLAIGSGEKTEQQQDLHRAGDDPSAAADDALARRVASAFQRDPDAALRTVTHIAARHLNVIRRRQLDGTLSDQELADAVMGFGVFGG